MSSTCRRAAAPGQASQQPTRKKRDSRGQAANTQRPLGPAGKKLADANKKKQNPLYGYAGPLENLQSGGSKLKGEGSGAEPDDEGVKEEAVFNFEQLLASADASHL
jgi:hypothetical protein